MPSRDSERWTLGSVVFNACAASVVEIMLSISLSIVPLDCERWAAPKHCLVDPAIAGAQLGTDRFRPLQGRRVRVLRPSRAFRSGLFVVRLLRSWDQRSIRLICRGEHFELIGFRCARSVWRFRRYENHGDFSDSGRVILRCRNSVRRGLRDRRQARLRSSGLPFL